MMNQQRDATRERRPTSGNRIPARARRATLLIVAGLALVLLMHLYVGIERALLYGLVGGLLGCLVVVALDLLHTARASDEEGSGEGER